MTESSWNISSASNKNSKFLQFPEHSENIIAIEKSTDGTSIVHDNKKSFPEFIPIKNIELAKEVIQSFNKIYIFIWSYSPSLSLPVQYPSILSKFTFKKHYEKLAYCYRLVSSALNCYKINIPKNIYKYFLWNQKTFYDNFIIFVTK